MVRIILIYKPCSWPFGRGPITPGLGDLLNITIVALTTYWDDPPSKPRSEDKGMTLGQLGFGALKPIGEYQQNSGPGYLQDHPSFTQHFVGT